MSHKLNCTASEGLQLDPYFGVLSEITTASRIDGPCGDDMTYFLLIKENTITDVKYFTERGCCNTRLAGMAVAKRVLGKTLLEALAVNPAEIISAEPELSFDGYHCAILAVTTLYRAIALFLLESGSPHENHRFA